MLEERGIVWLFYLWLIMNRNVQERDGEPMKGNGLTLCLLTLNLNTLCLLNVLNLIRSLA